MVAKQKNYYTALGVDRDADLETIKRAYRKLARASHPDINKEKGAADRFKEATEAFEVLSDDDKRAVYDRGGDPNDLRYRTHPDNHRYTPYEEPAEESWADYTGSQTAERYEEAPLPEKPAIVKHSSLVWSKGKQGALRAALNNFVGTAYGFAYGPGDDFSGMGDLSHKFFSSAERPAQLVDIRFNGTDLTYAGFSHSRFMRVDFTGSPLKCTNFSSSTLSDCAFTAELLSHAYFTRAVLFDPVFTGVRLHNVTFAAATLITASELPQPAFSYSGKQFTHCDFKEARLLGMNVEGSVFHNCDFENADLRRVRNLQKATFTQCKFGNALVTPDQINHIDPYNNYGVLNACIMDERGYVVPGVFQSGAWHAGQPGRGARGR